MPATLEKPGLEADERAEVLSAAKMLEGRARSLRRQALGLPSVLATTYRRRASELELASWTAHVQVGQDVPEINRSTPLRSAA